MNLARGWNNLIVVASASPSASSRHLMREAWRIERALPQWFDAYALPELMKRLDDEAALQTVRMDAPTVTRLVDAAVGLDYFSPLGNCLRRSLVRYVLLRRAGVPVVIHFGAKKQPPAGSKPAGRFRIAGHAWLTLDSRPFAEKPEDYQGFTPIYTYPANPKPVLSEAEASQLPTPNFQSPTPADAGRTVSNL